MKSKSYQFTPGYAALENIVKIVNTYYKSNGLIIDPLCKIIINKIVKKFLRTGHAYFCKRN